MDKIRLKHKPSFVLLSITHPLLTTLPFCLFIQTEFESDLYQPLLFIPIQILLLAGVIPIFRAYCQNQLYAFEDFENALTVRIIIVSIILGLITALITVKINILLIFFSLPYIFSLLFSYSIIVVEYLRDNRIGGIVILAYHHYKKMTSLLVVFMLSKVFFIVILLVLKYELPSFIWTFSGFLVDMILLIFIRSQIYILDIQRDGFFREHISPYRGLIVIPISIISSGIALIFSRNSSVLSKDLLIRFYIWLSSLFLYLPNRTGKILPDPDHTGLFSEKSSGLAAVATAAKEQYPSFLRPLLNIVAFILFVMASLLILYLIFYPFFVQLFTKGKKRISFKEYYRGIIRALLKKLIYLKKLIRSIFEKSSRIQSQELKFRDNSFSNKTDSTAISSRKKAELRTISKHYFRLRNLAEIKLKYRNSNSDTVSDFFNFMSDQRNGFNETCIILANIYNRSFFSSEELERKEFRLLKKLTISMEQSFRQKRDFTSLENIDKV